MPSILDLHPNTALVWNDEKVSYELLLQRVWAWSQRVEGAGERIVVFSENRPEWVYAAYGIWAAQKVLVPIDAMSSAEEVAYIIDDCEPGALICSEKTREVLDRALQLSRRKAPVLRIEEPVSVDPSRTASVVVQGPELAAIIYTSGTTGDPKGVMLTFGNLIANVDAVVKDGYFHPAARVLLLLPLHHVLPLAGAMMAPLYGGGTIVFATSLAGPDLVATLQKNSVTTIVGVPRFYDLLGRTLRDRIQASPVARALFRFAESVGSPSFSRALFGTVHRKLGGNLRHLVCGGAALDPETAQTFDVLGFRVCEGYGMTECAPMIAFPQLGKPVRIGSCGHALRDCEIRIENGEILARGPNVMKGYFRRPAETEAILRDGWIHTGDLGHLDEDGYLHVTGRLKEILVLPSGKNVNPIPIETEIQAASGAIREVGVFLDRDTLHALILLDRNLVPEAHRSDPEGWLQEGAIAPYNSRVAPYKRLARFTLVDAELPRTRLGKLRRHQLQGVADALRGGRADRTGEGTAQVSGSEGTAVAQLVAYLERLSRKPVSIDSKLVGDLGLDSLALVELAAHIEHAFGVVVSEAQLSECETVGELAGYLTGSAARAADGADFSWRGILVTDRPPELPTSSLWHLTMVHLLRFLVRLYFRTTARGLERLPAGPCIIAPNHESFFDVLFVGAHMRAESCIRTLFYAKEKHVQGKLLKYLAHKSKIVVMKEDEGFRPSLQKLAAGLRRGDNLMIFPEGTRTPDGSLLPFKESYAILARELAVPVLPVAIDGAFEAFPTGSRLPRPFAKISVTYLEPIHPQKDETVESLNRRVRDSIQTALDRG